jgi:hypothetical protein
LVALAAPPPPPHAPALQSSCKAQTANLNRRPNLDNSKKKPALSVKDSPGPAV